MRLLWFIGNNKGDPKKSANAIPLLLSIGRPSKCAVCIYLGTCSTTSANDLHPGLVEQRWSSLCLQVQSELNERGREFVCNTEQKEEWN